MGGLMWPAKSLGNKNANYIEGWRETPTIEMDRNGYPKRIRKQFFFGCKILNLSHLLNVASQLRMFITIYNPYLTMEYCSDI